MRLSSLAAGISIAALLVHQRRSRRRAERFAAAALESLLKAIDANDSQTGAHVRRVATYALVIADAIGVDDETRRTIELAALFHDIGKIHEALFDIVHEHRKLTPAERRAIATHPIRGARVLAPIAHFHPQLAEAVLAHHERWDGTGYPRGIGRNAIPLPARIVAVADAFDAVTHQRRYRGARNTREAADAILAGRGTQFDPALADLFLEPTVFRRLAEQHRRLTRRSGRTATTAARRPAAGERRNGRAKDRAPDVSFRWKTRSEPPHPVREKIADAS
jgi:putative two-component system response regulator